MGKGNAGGGIDVLDIVKVLAALLALFNASKDAAEEIADEHDDVLDVIAGLLQQDTDKLRRRARQAANRGDHKEAKRLQEKAYRKEERRGLPHPAEK